jgi:alanyl-tRNA synthetase
MDEKIAEAERAVNTLIDEDRPVRAWFPHPRGAGLAPAPPSPQAEFGDPRGRFLGLRRLALRRHPRDPHRAGGPLPVTSSERYKGGTRVTFSAGPRARGEARAEWLALSHAATLLETSREGVVAAIERLKERLDTEQEARGRLRAELAARIAESAAPDEEGRVFVDVSPEGGLELARQVASTLVRRAGATAIGDRPRPIESGAHLIVSRGPGASLDCGALVRKLTSAAGGKGGGRPEHAEGKLPRDFDVLTALRS